MSLAVAYEVAVTLNLNKDFVAAGRQFVGD